jgi:hypothetical protein
MAGFFLEYNGYPQFLRKSGLMPYWVGETMLPFSSENESDITSFSGSTIS